MTNGIFWIWNLSCFVWYIGPQLNGCQLQISLKRLKVKGHFIGLFQHCGRSAYCILTPNKQQVPASISRGATHHTDAQDLYQRRRELLPMNFASKSVIHGDSLEFFTCRKAGTWDILFYFPSEGRHTEDFPYAQKIQRLRPGLNPRTLVPVASMLTTTDMTKLIIIFRDFVKGHKNRLKWMDRSFPTLGMERSRRGRTKRERFEL